MRETFRISNCGFIIVLPVWSLLLGWKFKCFRGWRPATEVFYVMPQSALSKNFDQIEQLRAPVYERLSELSSDALWQKPEDGGWSFGQNLEHIYKLMRLARWAFKVACVGKPLAVLRRHRPYATTTTNPFISGRMPAPPGIRPKDRSSAPIPFDRMRRNLDGELEMWRSMTGPLADNIAGHICVWDPVVGLINMHQAVVVLRFHEEHHFRIVVMRLGN